MFIEFDMSLVNTMFVREIAYEELFNEATGDPAGFRISLYLKNKVYNYLIWDFPIGGEELAKRTFGNLRNKLCV